MNKNGGLTVAMQFTSEAAVAMWKRRQFGTISREDLGWVSEKLVQRGVLRRGTSAEGEAILLDETGFKAVADFIRDGINKGLARMRGEVAFQAKFEANKDFGHDFAEMEAAFKRIEGMVESGDLSGARQFSFRASRDVENLIDRILVTACERLAKVLDEDITALIEVARAKFSHDARKIELKSIMRNLERRIGEKRQAPKQGFRLEVVIHKAPANNQPRELPAPQPIPKRQRNGFDLNQFRRQVRAKHQPREGGKFVSKRGPSAAVLAKCADD